MYNKGTMAVKVDKMYKDVLYFPLTHTLLKIIFIKASRLLTYSSKYIGAITVRILVELNDFMSTMFVHQEVPLSKIHALLFIG